ncbi:hypothetical protein [Thiothrix unzii]|uniref:hypothetical protein n=1 Tax=Thiothrix unzii TaxID=111769 RepID=UPI002A3690A9|nr:hypothetical protein [Thiothrix unzii]MDX9990072.1 hypothetical protein [Thiothrix unzii]
MPTLNWIGKQAVGITLAVEYKGKHIAEHDKEKRQIGELWARRSNGRCRFVWVENKNWQLLKEATHG